TRPALAEHYRAGARELDPRLHERGVQRYRSLVLRRRARQIEEARAAEELFAAQEGIVRRQVARGPRTQRLVLPLAEMYAELLGHPPRDLGLHREHVRHVLGERVLPLRDR